LSLAAAVPRLELAPALQAAAAPGANRPSLARRCGRRQRPR